MSEASKKIQATRSAQAAGRQQPIQPTAQPPATQPKLADAGGGKQTGGDSSLAGDVGPGGGTGGAGSGTGGGFQPVTANYAPGGSGAFGSQYSNPLAVQGGASKGAMDAAGGAGATRLQDATPFWQSPGVQVASTHGYNPGQQYAGQRVTGESISGNPLIAAAMNDYTQNVMPGIQDNFNLMGLGRSTASGNAQAKAQAGMLLPLYQQMAGLEDSAINRQTGAAESEAGRSQQELDRMYGGTESELARRERSSNAQTDAQKWQAEFLASQDQQKFGQQAQGAQQAFDMGSVGRDYAQQANQSQYQDFLRNMGLSEEALNPFGGFQNMLGTVTKGK